ncbi:MAG: hypothetical protein IJ390_04670 [Lachnospiraceae bacterium]|nr:hypothetical protein [Lachnospiraceae bacterium]
MFGKKEKKKSKPEGRRVCVLGEEKVLYEGKLEELPLREDVILAKSEEFFHDPNPCYIHRGAVSIRLYLELEQALEKNNWELWNRYADVGKIDSVKEG